MKHNTRQWAGISVGILSLAGYASAATLGSEKYTYDASGNIIEKSIDGKVTRMAYDQENRLIGRESAGQCKETTAYDAAGRPVTELNADGQTIRSISYGYCDKVLETQTQNSKAVFFYNAEGQLVGKNVEGRISTYAWDGNVLASEGAEAFTNEAHISGGVPVLASRENVVVSDHLGNTLVSGATHFTSTAYGVGLEKGRFTGKPFVRELDSFFFNHRSYSPEMARWNSADPSGFPEGANNQAYVGNDPISRIDPSGLSFLHFNVNGNVSRYSGSGYNEQNGTIDWGQWQESWSAISNDDSASIPNGQTPEGWYLVGGIYEGNENMALGTERDQKIDTTWFQGGMSLWGELYNNSIVDYWGFSDYSNGIRLNRKSLTTPMASFTQCWKFDFGCNFQDGWGNFTWPSRRTPRSSFKIHPEGGYYGTNGCIGITNQEDAASLKQYLLANEGQQILVEK